ncbi:VCBS repeat-containing protein [Reichenbachiella sp. MSK19-1]|uniref:FG-GAP repeat domain-containing protein n=1 Tax=Reichenbachiella sp. MSK19-1 TaxID=1897631 RepID=UPI000E6B5FC7|nr:VCBS repeat-containing protein [Reichenbachiella sp. MSK19-1]
MSRISSLLVGAIPVAVVLFFVSSCQFSQSEKFANQYVTYCGSCHALPSIDDLPKHIWRDNVLPEMGAKMGMRDSTYSPYQGLSFRQMEAVMKTGHYPSQPMLSVEEWSELKEYIISLAPVSLPATSDEIEATLGQFVPEPIALDDSGGAFTAFLAFDEQQGKIMTANLSGQLVTYDYPSRTTVKTSSFGNAVTAYQVDSARQYATLIGILNPSELKSGQVYSIVDGQHKVIADGLHRPVHTLIRDLDQDGQDEIIISEFGHLTGELSMLTKGDTGYQKETLYAMPGVVRVVAEDMNGDGLEDLVFMASQGREGVFILYQEERLSFRREQVIGFSPVYGSSWFEMVDYDGDGDQDIITVNGDNADYSVVLKPYHGVRVFLNDGHNQFSEAYFRPIHGATRVTVRDFDQDGDMDMAVVATFPDYATTPLQSFVYLENQNSDQFVFEAQTFTQADTGRWLVMDAGDVDQDGDEDLILGSFTYSFVYVPDSLSETWNANRVDLMVLENQLVR